MIYNKTPGNDDLISEFSEARSKIQNSKFKTPLLFTYNFFSG